LVEVSAVAHSVAHSSCAFQGYSFHLRSSLNRTCMLLWRRYQDLDPSVAEKRAAAERAESRRAESQKALEIIHALEQLPDLNRPLNPKAAAAAAKATAASSSSSVAAATPKASEKTGSSKSHKKGTQSSSGKRGSGASSKSEVEGNADENTDIASAVAPLSPTSSLAATVASNGVESEFEQLCEAFLELPAKKELPEYYQVIKSPISLACMKERARRFEYSSVSGPPENLSTGAGGKGSGGSGAGGLLSGDSTLERDLRLMCDNAKRFNAVGSTVWRAAEALERAAARRLSLDPSAASAGGGSSLRPASELGLPPLPAELAAVVKPGAFWRQLVADLCLDCKDSQRGHWLKAKVVEVDDLGRALVHFQGWAKKWDEWYAVDSDDLAPAGTHTDQAPVALRVIDHLDEDALLAAGAFRVKAGVTLQVTCDAAPSSKKLGVLPAGMVVAVSDRLLSSCGRRVERVFFEQTSRPSAPARGWVNLRKKEGGSGGGGGVSASSGGSVDASSLLMDPVEAQGLGPVSPPLGHNQKLGGKGKNNGGFGGGGGGTAAEQAAAGNKQKRRRKPDTGAGDLSGDESGPVSSLGVGASAGCTECRWHVCKADDTPAGVAATVGCSAFDVVFLNKHLYAGLAASSKLRGGTRLRVPRPPDPECHDDANSSGGVGQVAPPSMWHECKENETPRDIAKRLNLAGGHAALVALNSKRFPDLAPGSRLRRGTRLRLPRAPRVLPGALNPGETTSSTDDGAKGLLLEHVPDLEELYQEALIAWEEDPDVVAYRHWTFPDDENVEDTHASYMMAKKIVRRPRSSPPPAITRFEAAAARHASTTAIVTTGGRRKRGLEEVDGGAAGSATDGPAASQASPPEEEALAEAGASNKRRSSSGDAPVPKPVVEAMEKALTAVKTATVPHDGNRLRCDLFLELPPRKHFPDYYVLISHPVCLKQIEKRLAANKAACSARPPKSYEEGCQPYGSLEDFSNEMQRLFDNARSYNLPKSEVYEDAEEMEVVFRDALATATATLSGDTGAQSSGDLFNKVVSVDAARDGSSLPYGLYFVLTYIPDLQWCRLGPLEIRGTFKKPSSFAGQPRWMLVRGEEAEADVSALRCSNVKARAVRKTNDADNEEWVITDAAQQGTAEAKAARGKAKMAVKRAGGSAPKIETKASACSASASSSASSSSATSLVAAAYATAVSAVSRAARAAAASPLLAPSAPTTTATTGGGTRRSPSPTWSHGSSRPSSRPPTPVCADVGGGGRLKLYAPAVSPRKAPLPVKPRAGAAGTLAAASKVAASVAAAAAAATAAGETSGDDESTTSSNARHQKGRGNGRASNGRGSSGGGAAAVPVEEEPAPTNKKRKASAVVDAKGKKEAQEARGGKLQSRAKRQRRSGAASEEDEDDNEDDDEGVDEEDEEEEDEIEALLASKMPSEPGRAQNAWGKAFLKYSVRVPAGAFGAVYAKDAASLWGLKAQACKLTKFVPHSASGANSNSRGYPRWEFEWIDPESSTVGTLDSKHLALYLRAHRDEPEESEEPSSGGSKEKGAAGAFTAAAETQPTQRRRSGR
jgi:hypothetical protein